MVGVIVVGVVVEVVRMAWFVKRRVWLLGWEDGGSEAQTFLAYKGISKVVHE